MSMFRGESGAQLLARLGSRPDISNIDPHIFRPLSSSSLTKPKGHLLELFGPEGVGKTELCMLYVAQACLPQTWGTFNTGGVGAKVVVVDTDLKFSLLRLAIVIEAQLLALTARLQGGKRDGDKTEESHSRPSTGQPPLIDSGSNHREKMLFNMKDVKIESRIPTSEKQNDNQVISFLDNIDERKMSAGHRKQNGGKRTNTVQGIVKVDCSGESLATCVGVKQEDNAVETESQEVQTGCGLTPEDIEQITMESLGRVRVVKPDSVQQLYLTLVSLEQSMTLDLDVGMVVLDSISAFFYEDRLAQNTAYWKGTPSAGMSMASKMAAKKRMPVGMVAVATVVSRFVSDLGLTVVMTKCALFGISGTSSQNKSRKRKWVAEGDCGDDKKDDEEHDEYLGRAWSDLNATRITLSLAEEKFGLCETKGKKIKAQCSLWPNNEKLFTFLDDVLTFL